jgi:hypothetical protein
MHVHTGARPENDKIRDQDITKAHFAPHCTIQQPPSIFHTLIMYKKG